ncbi:MAG: hypothetical protein JRN18_03305 [Nitrososphaerota archaeon]|nr:hypothetical protein [Nitrososphaerota archaeon]
MTAVGPSAFDLSIDALALVITGVSGYFVARQRGSQFPYVKGLLILVDVFFELILVQDVLRNLAPSPATVGDYSVFAATMVFADVILLTVIAYSVYFRPGGDGYRQRLRNVFLGRPHGPILVAFIAYVVGVDAYVVLYRPFTVVALATLGGTRVYSPLFDPTYLVASGVVLALFLAYPTLLLVRESLSVKDPGTRRNLVLLPFCWAGIGAEILVFNGYLVAIGYDYVAIGYAIAAILFGVTAGVFRKASALSSFFVPVGGPAQRAGDTGPDEKSVLDASIPVLFEVDPASNYEQALVSFAKSKTGGGGLVFVFTSRGSPVHACLAGTPGVRFYIMTSDAAYPTLSKEEGELLVPQNDNAVLLDLIGKTVSSTGMAPLAIVFDSLTEFSIYQGFESTYKFVKQANELLDTPRVSSVYLAVKAAQDEKETSLIKSLFRMHVAYDAAGLTVTRGPAVSR